MFFRVRGVSAGRFIFRKKPVIMSFGRLSLGQESGILLGHVRGDGPN
jgi:hypothetical protein